jgi:hypothetical protein
MKAMLRVRPFQKHKKTRSTAADRVLFTQA